MAATLAATPSSAEENESVWYFQDRAGRNHGPKSKKQLRKRYHKGDIFPGSYVWKEGPASRWAPLREYRELQDLMKTRQKSPSDGTVGRTKKGWSQVLPEAPIKLVQSRGGHFPAPLGHGSGGGGGPVGRVIVPGYQTRPLTPYSPSPMDRVEEDIDEEDIEIPEDFDLEEFIEKASSLEKLKELDEQKKKMDEELDLAHKQLIKVIERRFSLYEKSITKKYEKFRSKVEGKNSALDLLSHNLVTKATNQEKQESVKGQIRGVMEVMDKYSLGPRFEEVREDIEKVNRVLYRVSHRSSSHK